MVERTRELGKAPLVRPIIWDQSRSVSFIAPLDIFDASALTSTYPDSMSSCPRSLGSGDAARAYHGQVYTLVEIEDVVLRYGFPDPKLERNPQAPDAFIKV